LQTAGKSQIEQSVIKATFEDDEPPKPKHLKILIESSQPGTYVDVAGLLMKRFQTKTWNGILKSLIVIHYLAVDARVGGQAMLEDLARRGNLILLIPPFTVETAEQKQVASLIRPYAEYLTAKVATFSLLKRSCEREPPFEDAKWPPTLTIPELLSAIQAISKQLETGFDIGLPQYNGQVHPIAARLGDLILKDSLRLHSVLGLLYPQILAKKDQLSKQQTEQLSEEAARAMRINELLRTRVTEYIQLGIRKSLPALKFVGSDVALELKSMARTRGSSFSRPGGDPGKGQPLEVDVESGEKKKRNSSSDSGMPPRNRTSTPKTPNKSSRGSPHDRHSPQKQQHQEQKSPRSLDRGSPHSRDRHSPQKQQKQEQQQERTLDRPKSEQGHGRGDDDDDDEIDYEQQPSRLHARSVPEQFDTPPNSKGGAKKKKTKKKQQPEYGGRPSSPFQIRAPPEQLSSTRNRGASSILARPDTLSVPMISIKQETKIKSAPTSPQENKEVDLLSFDFDVQPSEIESTSSQTQTQRIDEPITRTRTTATTTTTTTTTVPATRPHATSVDHFSNLLAQKENQQWKQMGRPV